MPRDPFADLEAAKTVQHVVYNVRDGSITEHVPPLYKAVWHDWVPFLAMLETHAKLIIHVDDAAEI